MPKKKTSPEKKWLGLLGGTALFGYLGCQFPGSDIASPGSTAPVPVAVKDSTAPVAAKPDSVPQTIPTQTVPAVIVRNGPTAGEACVINQDGQRTIPACTREGALLYCYQGTLQPSSGGVLFEDVYCSGADTLPKFRHIGFTGIDKAGSRKSAVC